MEMASMTWTPAWLMTAATSKGRLLGSLFVMRGFRSAS
jgi:hypothetical protein